MIPNTEHVDIVDDFVSPSELRLDERNPRVTDATFASQEEVLEYLVDHADVDELVQSILSSGWLDYEPLVVLSPDNIVLEGNRRLVALRILADPDLRGRLNIELPRRPPPGALPERVRIRRVRSRHAARDYIGFKHINGPFKWDALAKAKYAAEWHQEGTSIEDISRRLGDGHRTVVRLVNGWNVLRQSYDVGFDRSETTRKAFPFSHLYTAIARPNVRRYLGLPDQNIAEILSRSPVPTDREKNLRTLMSWLYGQQDEPAVVRRQNPNLNQLVEVLGSESARVMLEASRDLQAAYAEVEDKPLKFSSTLMLTIKQAEETLKLVGNYDGRSELMSAGDNLRRTVLSLHGAMKETRARVEAGDVDDAGQ